MYTTAWTGRSSAATTERRRPELVWVGDGGWVARDPAVDAHDPGRVLAYLECKDGVVYVMCVTVRPEVIEFPTLRTALDALDAILVGGVRQSG